MTAVPTTSNDLIIGTWRDYGTPRTYTYANNVNLYYEMLLYFKVNYGRLNFRLKDVNTGLAVTGTTAWAAALPTPDYVKYAVPIPALTDGHEYIPQLALSQGALAEIKSVEARIVPQGGVLLQGGLDGIQ